MAAACGTVGDAQSWHDPSLSRTGTSMPLRCGRFFRRKLQIDTYRRSACLAVVPFRMTGGPLPWAAGASVGFLPSLD